MTFSAYLYYQKLLRTAGFGAVSKKSQSPFESVNECHQVRKHCKCEGMVLGQKVTQFRLGPKMCKNSIFIFFMLSFLARMR